MRREIYCTTLPKKKAIATESEDGQNHGKGLIGIQQIPLNCKHRWNWLS